MKKKTVIGLVILLLVAFLLYSYFVPQYVYIEEYGKLIVIDKRFKSIDLEVSGVKTDVLVSENTKISTLTVLGVDNDVILCEGIHDPKINNLGMNGRVLFILC